MIDEDLRTGLLADRALATLIGAELSKVERNRGGNLPAVTCQLAAPGRVYAHSGAVPLEGPRWQFDIWGTSALQVIEVRLALIAAAEGLAGTLVGGTRFSGVFLVLDQDWPKQARAEGDPDSRTTLHFMIWHRPASA